MKSRKRLESKENEKRRIESQIASLEELSEKRNQEIIAEIDKVRRYQLNQKLNNDSKEIYELSDKVDKIDKDITKLQLDDDFEYKLLYLEILLKEENWDKADKKTSEIMRELAEKQQEEDWGTEDFDKIPCCSLCKIDKLWQEYSDQKFGFSIQLSKWRKYQKKIDGSFDVIKYQKKFAESVGWYKTNKWLSWADERFGNNAKMKKDGLLPIPPPFKKDMSHSVELMPQLAKKIEECQGNHFCSED